MDSSRVFIASSSEQLHVAERVAQVLNEAPGLDAHPWNKGTFTFSKTYVAAIETAMDLADFAVVILTADDAANVRKEAVRLPRDNATLEFGLFMGRLGRPRCFFFIEGTSDTRLASDLKGVHPVTFYEDAQGAHSARRSLEEQTAEVKKLMLELGPRYKPSEKQRAKQDELWRLGGRISGHWWQRMRTDKAGRSSLSYVTITTDASRIAPHVNGTAYSEAGARLGSWRTDLTGIERDPTPRLLYRCTGRHVDAYAEGFAGSGSVEFDDPEVSRGHGRYADVDVSKAPEVVTTSVRQFRLTRCTDEHVQVMKRGNADEMEDLVRTQLHALRWR